MVEKPKKPRKTIIHLKIEVTDDHQGVWDDHENDHENNSQHDYLRTELSAHLRIVPTVEVAGWAEDGDGMMTLIAGDVISVRVTPTEKPGFIYFVQSKSGLFKIGRSKNPEKRILTLSTGCPESIELYRKLEVADMKRAEAFFHGFFASHRIQGEWFQINSPEVLEALEVYEYLNKDASL